MIAFTPRAVEVLAQTHQAARRFNPEAIVRVHRKGDGVEFSLTDRTEAGDEVLKGAGFLIALESGLSGTVDVVEPHDRLVLRGADGPQPDEADPGAGSGSVLF